MVFRKFVVARASAIVIISLPAAVSAQSNQIQQAMRYCRPDMERLCPGVPPGGGRIARCLKAHKMEISVGCANDAAENQVARNAGRVSAGSAPRLPTAGEGRGKEQLADPAPNLEPIPRPPGHMLVGNLFDPRWPDIRSKA